MPRPSEAANNSRARNVARISAATAAAGVFSQASAAPSPTLPSPGLTRGLRGRAWVLSAAEIFLIGGVVLDQHAAIDSQRHAGDHARRSTRQKQNGVGDILWARTSGPTGS